MPTYYLWPSVTRHEFGKSHGGIRGSLEAHAKLLPEFGWHEVQSESDADLVVGYLGTKSKRLDVFHLRGLYPTALVEFGDAHWTTNAKIIENLRRARHVVCVSDWVADTLRRDMHMQPHVVPGHGLDLEGWDKVGIYNSECPYALWNKSRMHGVCNPQPVYELAKRFPDFKFITTFMPHNAGPSPNVTITGVLPYERAWEYVKGASIYIATTKETFGRGTLEAMASGCHIVGFDWGATPVVLDGCGTLVRPGDYDALVDAFDRAMQLAASGPDRNARARVEKYFGWRDVVAQTVAIYNLALQRHDGPKVSIVIPCHNYERYVVDAIAGVRMQTYQDWELVIVDDGSTDGSVEVIERAIADEPRIKFIKQSNCGVAHARNNGISHAVGEYVMCLDADDGIAPDILEKLVPVLDGDRKLGITYAGIRIMSDAGRVRHTLHSWPKPYVRERGLHGNQIPTCCLFRRSWWERLGGYRQRFAPHGAGQEDSDFFFRILANGGGAQMVEEGLFYYRVHSRQVTKKHREFWAKNTYPNWHPYSRDGEHPIASQLAVPSRKSWPVRDYDCPVVSVIIPVGPGHEDILVDALDSVEAQTFREWELIVVNDSGSPLNLTPWPYVRLVTTDGNMGAGYARNEGTKVAKAPLLVYLDADDFLQATFIQDTLDVHDKYPGVWIYTDMSIYRSNGDVEHYVAPDWDLHRLWRSGLAPITCLYPKYMWEKVGGFNEQLSREDWDFHLRLASAGYCGIRLAKELFVYRHSTGSRRNDGARKREIQLLHQWYNEEELAMACSGCGRRKRVSRVAKQVGTPKSWQTKQDAGWPILEFVGKNKNDLTFRGNPTRPGGRRRIYRAGNNRIHKYIYVHPDDEGHLLRHRCFVKADTVKMTKDGILIADAKPKPKPKPKVKSESKPDRLPDIASLSVRAAQAFDLTRYDLNTLIADERSGKNRGSMLRHLQKLQRSLAAE